MLKRKTNIRLISLTLALIMISQTFLLNYSQSGQLFAEDEVEIFSPAKALSPGEYLHEITLALGANPEEIEEQSYAQWFMLLTNVLIMLDPKATDVMSLQHSINKTLNTAEKIRNYSNQVPKVVNLVEKIAGFGFKHFPRAASPKMQNMLFKVQNAMSMLGKKQGMINLHQGTSYMKSPYRRGASACKQWYKKGAPLVDNSRSLSSIQTSAMKVGSVLQIVAGVMELSRFNQALGEDAGAPGFATVQIGINGAILIATALMAWPPPGAWTVAAFIIIGAWEVIKKTLNYVGGKIEKWHKSYADSLNFLRETDDEFRAFYDHNPGANSSAIPGSDSDLIDPLERSAALVFADELQLSLSESPGEGDIAERQQELVKNIRAQGLLSTWYYQQADAARMLPGDIEDLYTIWNHRADYMAWKPKKPKWGWNPIALVGDSLSWAGNTVMEDILGTHDQLVEDKKKYPEMALFCPDFALMILFRRFVTSQAQNEMNGEIPELLSLAGIRIEQSPFNYMPLIEIYNNNFNNWNDEIIGQSFAADSLIVAAKEMPYLVEQLNFSTKNYENSTMLTMAKIMGIEVLGDNPELPASEMIIDLFEQGLLKQLDGSARARAQFDALLSAYNNDPLASLKDVKVEYSFNEKSHDFKLLEELFRGKRIFKGEVSLNLKVVTPEVWSGILKGEDVPDDAQDNAEYMFAQFSQTLENCLQLNLNSTGISGIDLVKLGIQLKNEIDLLELAKDSLADKKKALAERNQTLTSDAIKALVDKGEFLDVKRSWHANFLSSFDPPIDLLEHSLEKLEKAISEQEKSLQRRLELVEKIQPLLQQEYRGWLSTLRNYEDSATQLGLSLAISSADENYAVDKLDFLAPFVALDPAAEVK